MLLLQSYFMCPVIYVTEGKTFFFQNNFRILSFIICFYKDSCIHSNQSQITEVEKKFSIEIASILKTRAFNIS